MSQSVSQEYDSEKRIAVVMYGGVSLAIYMGGVAQELLNVVRATAPAPGKALRPSDRALSPLEQVYRDAATRAGGKLISVTIDVISGTSAGGINGIFLAKALSRDLDMKQILDLWVEEGDLGKLLNDRKSAAGTGLRAQDPPVALLNGQRMYLKLLEAFDAMDDTAPASSRRDGPSFDAGRLDLFVTTTDLAGETIRLPVSNAVARERRHRQRLRFEADGPEGDFARDQNPILAFAARCTSSFPVAFEPFTWNDAKAIAGSRCADLDWKDRLWFFGENYENRPMADGGYLDNKPFSHAIDQLALRQSNLPVERVLMYVEPDPESILDGSEPARQSTKPDAFGNAAVALTLPGYETIREDLERVIARNARVEELEHMQALVSKALEERESESGPEPFSAKDWLELADAKPLIKKYGAGYPVYHYVKVSSVIDMIADVVCSTGSIGRPETARVIRELVVQGLGKAYPTFPDELQLLLDADLDYRLRKYGFVLRRLNADTREVVAPARRALQRAYEETLALKATMRTELDARVHQLRKTVLDDEALAYAAGLSGKERTDRIAGLLERTKATEDLKPLFKDKLAVGLAAIADSVRDALRAPELAEARADYLNFEHYDQVLFPIAHHGGIDEVVPVRILRVSPQEANPRRAKPLAGRALGHFGAFLEGDFRRNDILCGRLDAAEVIIRELGPPDAKELIERAHREIIDSQLKEELQQRIGTGDLPPSIRKQALEAINDRDKLSRMFKQGNVYALELDPARQVDNAGRAGIILEQLTRGWALKGKLPFPGAIRYGVLMLAMLGQVALPRSLARTVAAYWGRLLFLFFTLMLGIGWLRDMPDMKWTAAVGMITIAVLATVTTAIASLLGDRRARRLFRVLKLGVLGAAVLAGIWSVRSSPAEFAAWVPDWTFSQAGLVLQVVAIAGSLVLATLLGADLVGYAAPSVDEVASELLEPPDGE